MGISAGGLIIPFNGTYEEAIVLLEKIEEKKVYLEKKSFFDTRDSRYFNLEIINGYLIIHYADYYFSLLNDEFVWCLKLRSLDLIKPIIAFGLFDSGGYYGYLIYENGEFVRSISQDVNDDYKIKIVGEPAEFENTWLNASTFYLHEFEDENGEWKTEEIEPENVDEQLLDEWSDDIYQKCYYLENKDDFLCEEGLVQFLFSKLCIDIIGNNFVDRDYGDDSLNLSTEKSPDEQISDQAMHKISFISKIKQLFKM